MFPYRSFSHKTIGASHVKDDLPCQDAALSYADENMAIAIVADGHGSPQYFRSDVGSRIAAQAALDGMKSFVNQMLEDQTLEEPKFFERYTWDELLRRLAQNIISSWFNGIAEDEQAFPLAEDVRMEKLEEKYRARYMNDSSHQYFSHAYGTTLVAAAVTENYWFGLHIGDGKCVALFDNGDWEQPIPWDESCFLNATTSICDNNAIGKFRFWYGPTARDARRPVALFVNSDGVDDTYPLYENEKHLKYLYRAVVLSSIKDGFEDTSSQVAELVKRFAVSGSCDDVSISGIIHTALRQPLIDFLVDANKSDRAAEELAEERRKAETKKQALQAAQARAEQAAKKKAELARSAQIAEQELAKKNSLLETRQEEKKRIKRSIADAQEEKARAEAEHAKAQDELHQASTEYDEVQKGVSTAESDFYFAEDHVQEQEAQAGYLKARAEHLKNLLAPLFDPNKRADFAQYGQDIKQVIQTAGAEISGLNAGLRKTLYGPQEPPK